MADAITLLQQTAMNTINGAYKYESHSFSVAPQQDVFLTLATIVPKPAFIVILQFTSTQYGVGWAVPYAEMMFNGETWDMYDKFATNQSGADTLKLSNTLLTYSSGNRYNGVINGVIVAAIPL